jgi:hypothetical protein
MSEKNRKLFHKYFNKAESKQERDELMQFIDNPGSEAIVKDLMEEVYKERRLEEDPFSAGSREKMLGVVFGEDLMDNNGHVVVPMKRSLSWLRYAAAAVLTIGLSFGVYKYMSRDGSERLAIAKIHHDINPGGNKAVLTLANGSKIQLDDAKNGRLVQQGNSAVVKLANGSLVYSPGASYSGAPVNNTMSTPRGGQYRLQLPDGTKVMLNAQSSITYPTAFTGHSRNVTVTGEAYFEVTKNKKMPFIVSFGNEKVEVLGTHFDIRAYASQPRYQTTLVEGSVRLSSGNIKQMLIPGQQASYDTDARAFNVQAVDTDDILAWTNGLFVFDNTELGQVIEELSRWYNVDFIYKGNQPGLHFTGLIKRDLTLSRALKLIETTSSIKFTISGNEVIIEKK